MQLVRCGDWVTAEQELETFMDWLTGDYLHLDMAMDPVRGPVVKSVSSPESCYTISWSEGLTSFFFKFCPHI